MDDASSGKASHKPCVALHLVADFSFRRDAARAVTTAGGRRHRPWRHAPIMAKIPAEACGKQSSSSMRWGGALRDAMHTERMCVCVFNGGGGGMHEARSVRARGVLVESSDLCVVRRRCNTCNVKRPPVRRATLLSPGGAQSATRRKRSPLLRGRGGVAVRRCAGPLLQPRPTFGVGGPAVAALARHGKRLIRKVAPNMGHSRLGTEPPISTHFPPERSARRKTSRQLRPHLAFTYGSARLPHRNQHSHFSWRSATCFARGEAPLGLMVAMPTHKYPCEPLP